MSFRTTNVLNVCVDGTLVGSPSNTHSKKFTLKTGSSVKVGQNYDHVGDAAQSISFCCRLDKGTEIRERWYRQARAET